MSALVASTVISPAGSLDLVDLATVKEELGIAGSAQDTILRRYITAASRAAADYVGRTLVKETVEDRFQTCSPLRVLQLSRRPAAAVLAVSEGATALGQSDFSVYAEAGQLARLDSGGNISQWSAGLLVARYEAGYALVDVPADLQDAIIRAVGQRWFARNRDPMLRSEIVEGVAQFQYWVQTDIAGGGGFAPDVQAVLRRYADPGL